MWRGELENDGLNGWCSTRAERPRGHDPARDRQVPAPGAASRFAERRQERALHGAPRHRCAAGRAVQRPASTRRPRRRRRRERLADGSSRRSTPSRASTRTACCAASSRWSARSTRTDYFQRGADGRPKPYLAFKLDPQQLPVLPAPRPRFEIFVYSPRVEGVHLRGGRVARGGVRWSDRREDFRTEVLGLMKAQTVKNAVIVPVGAKGGFVVKRPPAGGRVALHDEAIACYRTFVASLLDLTDNIVERRGRRRRPASSATTATTPISSSPPTRARPRSPTSPTRSPPSYGFWLGDAFASGGSQGYDHKRMGITARGAWEAVKRHFRELGTDIQTSDFTVVGIGDMSGDVFGNGMLLSRAHPG